MHAGDQLRDGALRYSLDFPKFGLCVCHEKREQNRDELGGRPLGNARSGFNFKTGEGLAARLGRCRRGGNAAHIFAESAGAAHKAQWIRMFASSGFASGAFLAACRCFASLVG